MGARRATSPYNLNECARACALRKRQWIAVAPPRRHQKLNELRKSTEARVGIRAVRMRIFLCGVQTMATRFMKKYLKLKVNLKSIFKYLNFNK